MTSLLASAATALVLLMCTAVVLVGVGPSLGLWRADVVLSGSMRPSFSEGSAILAVKASSESLVPGDVIVYLPPPPHASDWVAHRVVSVSKSDDGNTTIITKGDSNSSADPWGAVVPPESVWLVKADVPLLGHVAAGVMRHRLPVALLALSVLFGCLARKGLSA